MKGKKTGGREKGVPNKLTATAKENTIHVFNLLQSTEPSDKVSFFEWAKQNPTDFYTRIYTKLIPTAVDMKAEIEGFKQVFKIGNVEIEL